MDRYARGGFNVGYETRVDVRQLRAKRIAELRDKMEDERGGGASVIEAAQKLGLAAVTIDAADRSGRAPNGQPLSTVPQGLDVVSQAFNSDVGVDNDPPTDPRGTLLAFTRSTIAPAPVESGLPSGPSARSDFAGCRGRSSWCRRCRPATGNS